MKKLFAIVALVASMFVAGNVQAQSMIYAGYAPETFTYSNNSNNYQGFFVGFSQNFGLAKGFGVAAGAQLHMNTKSNDSFYGLASGKSTQLLIDVPIMFNYGINVNRDITITPFVGPMVSLGIIGNTHVDTVLGNSDVNWYGDGINMGRFNLYGVLGANLKFSQFNIFGGYRLGLLEMNNNLKGSFKTNGMFVGLGFAL